MHKYNKAAWALTWLFLGWCFHSFGPVSDRLAGLKYLAGKAGGSIAAMLPYLEGAYAFSSILLTMVLMFAGLAATRTAISLVLAAIGKRPLPKAQDVTQMLLVSLCIGSCLFCLILIMSLTGNNILFERVAENPRPVETLSDAQREVVADLVRRLRAEGFEYAMWSYSSGSCTILILRQYGKEGLTPIRAKRILTERGLPDWLSLSVED